MIVDKRGRTFFVSSPFVLFAMGALSRREFLDWYRNPANYRPELPKTNRSHKYE